MTYPIPVAWMLATMLFTGACTGVKPPPEPEPKRNVRCVPLRIKDPDVYRWIHLCGEVIPGIEQDFEGNMVGTLETDGEIDAPE